MLRDARAEMDRATDEIEAACAIPTATRGYHQENIGPDLDLKVTNVPRGVFFMVPSFNFPAMVPLEYLPYAVAAGCTYIDKPSPQVPITQTRIFELIDQCGFPPGVVNLVHGGADVVDRLLEHPDTEGFSFVGSTKVGAELYRRAGVLGKRAQAATSAKNHFVVMPDADLDRTVDAAMSSFFGSGGQRCLAGSVLVPVAERLRAGARRPGRRRLEVATGQRPRRDRRPRTRRLPRRPGPHRRHDRHRRLPGRGAAARRA